MAGVAFESEYFQQVHVKSFLGIAGESIDKRECGKFEGLHSKVKLSLYIW